MSGLERLAPAGVDDALAYLSARPHDNVYVGWVIASSRGSGEEVLLWRDDRGRIAGICYFGPQIVACGDDAAIDAFAAACRRSRPTRMIVGPRPAIERLWQRTRDFLPEPAAVRTSQPVYMLDRAALRGAPFDAGVARATLGEVDEIVPHSAQMIAGEIGGDPLRTNADFRARTARIVERGWWWNYRVGGTLAFMCNVGSAAFGTAQLQGVWTPPGLRGHGHATRALAAIAHRLLDDYATLCLYVNDFNAPAIALYERVGFARAGEFQTILFR
jgi:RimJ/RimL family protein N-acetyltransferase